jgi:hypothetical protein
MSSNFVPSRKNSASRLAIRSAKVLALPLGAILVAACFVPPSQPAVATLSAGDIQARALDGTDANAMLQLEASRKAAKRGGMAEARQFAAAVAMLYDLGTIGRGKADGPTLLQEADGYLAAAATALPAEAAEGLAARGQMYLAAKDKVEGERLLRASMDKRATPTACVLLVKSLDEDGQRAEIGPLCKKTIAKVTDAGDRFAVLDTCARASHASTVEGALSWASKDDIAFYRAKQDEITAQNAAYQERRQAERDRQKAEFDQHQREEDAKEARRSNCRAMCQSSFGQCEATCGGGGGSCWGSCVSAKNDCISSCR